MTVEEKAKQLFPSRPDLALLYTLSAHSQQGDAGATAQLKALKDPCAKHKLDSNAGEAWSLSLAAGRLQKYARGDSPYIGDFAMRADMQQVFGALKQVNIEPYHFGFL